MNTFIKIKKLVDLYEGKEDNKPTKEDRGKIKDCLAIILSDVINVNLSKDNISVLRREYGVKAYYYNNDNKVEIYKITFSMMTKKVYLYDGYKEVEFKIF